MNKVILMGNLVKNPEAVETKSGMFITKFTIATSIKRKDQEVTEYSNCIAFGKTGEAIQKFFSKGKPIMIEGRLQTRSWEQDGMKKYMTEIVTDSFQFVPQGPVGSEIRPKSFTQDRADREFNELTTAQSEGVEYPEEDINPEDIPF